MKAARYHFVSEYTFQGERQAIWRALVDFEHTGQWWKGLKRLEIVRPAASGDGTGLIYRNYARARRSATPLITRARSSAWTHSGD